MAKADIFVQPRTGMVRLVTSWHWYPDSATQSYFNGQEVPVTLNITLLVRMYNGSHSKIKAKYATKFLWQGCKGRATNNGHTTVFHMKHCYR